MTAASLVTFVVPVRHPDNARDWSLLTERLLQTAASIANQTRGNWRAVVVANEGADISGLPGGFDIVRVTFPRNELHDIGTASLEEVYEAFRADKGRRVLAGMLAVPDTRFFMIVDDDDLVSARIVQHVSANPDANGWVIQRGYIWDDGGRLLLGYDNFNRLCGTSLIVRSDLYGLPVHFEDASLDWVRSMLGSHVRIADILAGRGTPLEPLPFRGAIYRVAHGGSHSRAPSLLSRYFLSRQALKRPRRLLRHLGSLRLLGDGIRGEFFGGRGSSVAPPRSSVRS